MARISIVHLSMRIAPRKSRMNYYQVPSPIIIKALITWEASQAKMAIPKRTIS